MVAKIDSGRFNDNSIIKHIMKLHFNSSMLVHIGKQQLLYIKQATTVDN